MVIMSEDFVVIRELLLCPRSLFTRLTVRTGLSQALGVYSHLRIPCTERGGGGVCLPCLALPAGQDRVGWI